MTLSEVLSNNKSNNFTIIRLFLALGVLYNHSFVLFHSYGKKDLTEYLFSYFDSGSLSVSLFFFISGLFLTKSFCQTDNLMNFILKRMFRIFPALIICLVITVFLFGPITTNLNLYDYYSSKETYRYFYNILLSNEFFIFDIPGCLSKNFKPSIINGSLWTLPFEVICYIFLTVLLVFRSYIINGQINLYRKSIVVILFLYLLSYLFGMGNVNQRFLDLITGFSGRFVGVNSPLRLYIFFVTGVVLYFLREKFIIRNLTLVILLFIWLLIIKFHVIGISRLAIECINLVYITLWFSSLKNIKLLNFKIDASYGVYLFSWPIQQIISMFLPEIGAYQSMFISLPVVLVIGVLSFLHIEKPASRLVQIIMAKIT